MALNKYRLGELIELSEHYNSDLEYALDSVMGMTITKQIIPTRADASAADLSKYLIVYPNDFIYNPRTHGKKIGLGFNDTDKAFLISWNNTAFRIKESAKSIISPVYLFMHFNRSEWDRKACFNSWGSSTEVFSWNALCDMEFKLPSIEIQKKYVAIYKSMIANQQSYERGLEDLKLVCDGYIEDLRRNMPCEKIGPYIEESNTRNENLDYSNIQGVNSSSRFGDTKANTTDLDFHNYKVVKTGQFAYNPSRINLGSIALLKEENCIVSPMYIVFKSKDESKLLPEYLMLWYERKEFQRSTLFYATGSVRDTFSFDLMKEVKIPIPEISVQKAIADIYNAYNKRKMINEQLKEQLKDICPILIKGSLVEA